MTKARRTAQGERHDEGETMPAVIATDAVAPGDRIDYWQQRGVELFDIPYRVECPPGQAFRANLAVYSLGTACFAEVCAMPFSVRREGLPERGYVYVLILL